MKKNKEISRSLQLQFYFLLAILVLGIYCFTNSAYWIVLGMMTSLLFFLMAYNNYKVYKRKYVTGVYILWGIILAVILGLQANGINILP